MRHEYSTIFTLIKMRKTEGKDNFIGYDREIERDKTFLYICRWTIFANKGTGATKKRMRDRGEKMVVRVWFPVLYWIFRNISANWFGAHRELDTISLKI